MIHKSQQLTLTATTIQTHIICFINTNQYFHTHSAIVGVFDVVFPSVALFGTYQHDMTVQRLIKWIRQSSIKTV